MRALALALLLAGQAWSASTAANTVAVYYFQGNANDYSNNGYNLATIGTLPYSGAPVAAPYGGNAGKFSDANFLSSTASLNAAFSGLSAYTIQFYIYLDTDTTQPVFLRYIDGGGPNYIEVLNTGAVFWVAATKPNLTGSANDVLEDAWTHVAFVWDGTNRKIYVNNVLKASTASGNNTGTITSMEIGRYQPSAGFFIDGYMAQLRLSNVALSSFPTLDPSGATNRSPYLDLFLYPEESFLRRLGNFFAMLTLPSELSAHVQDQRVQQNQVESAFVAWERRTGRLTRTPTPTTAQRATRTPTPNWTPTSSPTPSPVVTPTRTVTRTR